MRDPYWSDPTATMYLGNTRDVLADLPAGSVDCIVTRPPRWTPYVDPSAEGETAPNLGYEATPALYVAALRRVCAEAHRVLTDDGTFWLILGDRDTTADEWAAPAAGRHTRRVVDSTMTGLPASSFIGLPWQVAFALHDDGWKIRNSIVWDHGHPDESTTGRLPLTYELIFLLTKQDRHHFDAEAIWQLRQHSSGVEHGGTQECRRGKRHSGSYGNAVGRCRNGNDSPATMPPGNTNAAARSSGTRPGDVWTVPGNPTDSGMPLEVPLRCITAGCRPGGTVLDPFAGTATTGTAARDLELSFIGIETDPALCELARARLSPDLGDTGAESE